MKLYLPTWNDLNLNNIQKSCKNFHNCKCGGPSVKVSHCNLPSNMHLPTHYKKDYTPTNSTELLHRDLHLQGFAFWWGFGGGGVCLPCYSQVRELQLSDGMIHRLNRRGSGFQEVWLNGFTCKGPLKIVSETCELERSQTKIIFNHGLFLSMSKNASVYRCVNKL